MRYEAYPCIFAMTSFPLAMTYSWIFALSGGGLGDLAHIHTSVYYTSDSKSESCVTIGRGCADVGKSNTRSRACAAWTQLAVDMMVQRPAQDVECRTVTLHDLQGPCAKAATPNLYGIPRCNVRFSKKCWDCGNARGIAERVNDAIKLSKFLSIPPRSFRF